MKKALFVFLVTMLVSTVVGTAIQILFSIKIRGWGMWAILLLSFLASLVICAYLPEIWEKLENWMKRNYDNTYRNTDQKPLLVRIGFLALVFAYFFYVIAQAFFAFGNWYMNRNATFLIHIYDTLTPLGVLEVGITALLLTVLFWQAMHKSARCRSAAAILALIYVVISVGVFLDLGGISVSGAELRDALLTDAVIGEIVPISLPDWGVVLVAAPALVLSYYGCSSRLEKLARLCKYAAFGLIVLSSTGICTVARIMAWGLFN